MIGSCSPGRTWFDHSEHTELNVSVWATTLKPYTLPSARFVTVTEGSVVSRSGTVAYGLMPSDGGSVILLRDFRARWLPSLFSPNIRLVTVYLTIGPPPVKEGGVHESRTKPMPTSARTLVGGPGGSVHAMVAAVRGRA